MNALDEYQRGKLFCDLKTREDVIEFLRCGRAHETGIIASGVGETIAKHMAEMAEENRALSERVKRLEAWGDRLEELLGDPPNANCSCHISPPCNDCVEWAAIREAKAEWSNAKGQP